MGYVDEHLLPGEQVVHRAHIHKIIFLLPGLFAAVILGLGVAAIVYDVPLLAIAAVLIAAVPLIWTWIAYSSSEFAITDKRVIIKVGWIQRRTLETMLGKVEGIGVDQSVWGRLIDFGTITVTGTGGTREQFANIAAPLEFRRQVQGQISAADSGRGVEGPGPAGYAAVTGPRDERECPWCAERILVRARVCKHCGREVEPLVAS